MGIASDVKALLTIKKKERLDCYSSQFSRVFLVKVCMVSTLFFGMNWYKDDLKCIILDPKNNIGKDFVKQACWINGLYIFESLPHQEEISYHGIPRELQYNGINSGGSLCTTKEKQSGLVNTDCAALPKTFYLQYQYMVFISILLALLYYSPYLLWKLCNVDVENLHQDLQDNTSATKIVNSYFEGKVNKGFKYKSLGNFLVQILYIAVNVTGFLLLDTTFNGRFKQYGSRWANWSKLENEDAYNYGAGRTQPRPGNALLPSFALCDVHESAVDIKHEVLNDHTFVCELSGHVLYQYMLLIFWFCMIGGLVVSVVGLVIYLVSFINITKLPREMSFRELDYLRFMRQYNSAKYRQVLAVLSGIKGQDEEDEPILMDKMHAS